MQQSGSVSQLAEEKEYQAIKELFASEKRMKQDFLSASQVLSPDAELTHYLMLCGTYDKSALIRLFDTLKHTLFAKKEYGPVGLHINNIHHMISVFYDFNQPGWLVVNDATAELVSQEAIADKVMEIFAEASKFVVLSINIFGHAARQEILHDYLRKLHDWDKGYLEAYSTRTLVESDCNGMKLIHLAGHYGREDVVSFLLEAGANINEVIGGNNSVLTLAIQAGYRNFVDFLLHHDANINAQATTNLFTPLMMAIWVHDADIVARLLAEPGLDLTKTVEISASVFTKLAQEENYTAEQIQVFIKQHSSSGKLKFTARDLAAFVDNAAINKLL